MNLKTNCFKKLISLILCLCFVFGNSVLSFAQKTEGLLGDIDGNNIINAEDASIVLAAVLGSPDFQLTEEEEQRARVTGNKVITVNDAVRILQKVLDNSVEFIPFVESSESTTTSSAITITTTTEDTSTTESAITTTTEDTTTTTTEISTTITTEDTTTTTTEISTTTTTEDTTTTTTEESTTTTTEESTTTTTEESTETTTLIASLNVMDAFSEEATLTADTPAGDNDFFTIKATSNKFVKITSGNKNYNDTTYGKRITLSGSGEAGANGYRSVAFDVIGNATVKVLAVSGGKDERTLYLASDEGDVVEGDKMCPISSEDLECITFKYYNPSNESKTLYLYGSNNILIYKIDVYSGISDKEETTENTTEATTEAISSEPTTEIVTKAPDASLKLDDTAEAKDYTENISIGNIEIIADSTNKVSIVDTNETVGETVYNKAFNISSNGDKTSGALSVSVDKPSRIAVVAKGISGTEKIVMANSLNDTIEEQTVSDKAETIHFSYIIPEAGNVYLYANDVSDVNNLTIYSIEIYNVSSNEKFNHTGFGAGEVTGGGIVDASNSVAYKQVRTAAEFDEAIKGAKNKKVKVIEIMNDLNLGINEIKTDNPDYNFTTNNIIQDTIQALNNDILKESGVSSVYIQDINGLTIFSRNGSTIKHSCWLIKRCENVIIRNLKFDELWEWDEGDLSWYSATEEEKKDLAAPGDYDRNDWDYILFDNSHNAWVDHCTFNKAYDGLIDIKNTSNDIAISWCKFLGDDQSAESWVTKQINYLEDIYTNNKAESEEKYPLYYHLREVRNYTPEQIIAVEAPHKKAHLVGQSDTDPDMNQLSVTIYNCYYKDIQDRMPRLRGGNAHIFNTVIDSEGLYRTKNEINPDPQKDGVHFGLSNQGLLSTCGGALLGENLYMKDVSSPMSYEQTAPNNGRTFDGKILAKNIRYELHKKRSTTEYIANYPSINSTDGDSNFTPTGKGTPMQPFSWNEGISAYIKDGNLTYNYDLIDTDKLETEVVPLTGAKNESTDGWSTEQWLSVKYE